MRYSPAAGLLLFASLYASAASAGPLDTLMGLPDAPGVVAGGSFGPNGNDYFGDMRLRRPSPRPLADRYARVRPRPAKTDRPRPKS
ncbi:hypothetical protein ASF49_16230 [Methylobacterium sp. Leaf104]|uniref:hypothetical protein n=1 Tax=Methylobacterium sp. Leaf104 TaxID=1736254 RepID=UPI0006FE6711|nr:hypothetical protein [Methylobacterium sp. Leaf104]KQP29698.1 hypothetical protein ASF49_16230 [Methylobacterium sp. Leaf104]